MAYGITHTFKGGNKAQYEAAIATVHPADGLPEGQTYHFAGETEEGDFVIVAIFDSKESWERFRDDTLGPGLESADGAFETPPEERAFIVHNAETA